MNTIGQTSPMTTALALVVVFSPTVVSAESTEFTASGFNRPRIEREDKLSVPSGETDEVWRFLCERYVSDQSVVRKLDPLLSARAAEESFEDTYFDTPTLQVLGQMSGVRHRKRLNVTDPNEIKSGRELMQIKISGISSNMLDRAEIKFPIAYPDVIRTAEDQHPMLGIVKRSNREEFKQRLIEMGLDPPSMKPVFTLKQRRRRVYLLKEGKPFLSLSLDTVTCHVLWAKTEFVELEPELNEIAFTEADSTTRQHMDDVLRQITADIKARFPLVSSDLTPKYNKAFNRTEESLPFFRLWLSVSRDFVCGSLVVAGAAVLGIGYGARRGLRRFCRHARR